MNQHNNSNNSIVLVGGCFDILHVGHIHFLTEASKLGTTLVVALESDENVKMRKGDQRPIHTQEQRKYMIQSLSVIHRVISLPVMVNDIDYQNLVVQVHPHIIAVTEGDPYITQKSKQADIIQATIVEIPKIHTPSTSQLAKLIGLE